MVENAGAAYLFDVTTGNLLNTFYSPNPVSFDLFGWSVAIDGDNLVIGARLRVDSSSGGTRGTAYVYEVEATAVPEPLTILGAGVACGFGTAFKRKLAHIKRK